MCCRFERCLIASAALALVSALLVGGIQLWMKEKSYVFSAEELVDITNQALRNTSCKLGWVHGISERVQSNAV